MNKNLLAVGVMCSLMAARGNKNRSAGNAPAQTKEINVHLLREIGAAGTANTVFYVAPAHAAPLLAVGLIEVNTAMVNDKGEQASRLTQAGGEYLTANGGGDDAPSNDNTEPEQSAEKPTFNVVSNVPVPAGKRGGRTGTTYPFDALQLGQSFFVPATTAKPNPAKSLASTVSSATARYAVENGTRQVQEKDNEGNKVFLDAAKTQPKMVTVPKYDETRKFVARPVADGAPWGSPGVVGAGVFRTK